MTKSGFLLLLVMIFAFCQSFGQGSDGKGVRIQTQCMPTQQESKDPLFVVIVGEDQGVFERRDIAGLHPEQIREMKVLKTPEARAEYGQPGENGVVLIWLKEESRNQLPKALEKKLTKIEPSDFSPL
ncbi:hypothetical protein [Algoriphagus confluentis]|uniref:TonB-dependent receptor plug domain-containing protein n=1 Tax=Algoriphagus confluentis TaxID=1697556 RepID=A0ABQ6PLX5_9BACT|nr:hypothetical protein Aconfl_16020 [Algoriphagus confluentis]